MILCLLRGHDKTLTTVEVDKHLFEVQVCKRCHHSKLIREIKRLSPQEVDALIALAKNIKLGTGTTLLTGAALGIASYWFYKTLTR